MVSTFGSLNTMVSGLKAQQLSLNTVGHNIANIDTPGYSRQRVNLVASNSQTIYTNGGPAQLGQGVTTQSITRIRDSFLDRQYWKQNSILGTFSTAKTYLNKIEDVFGESSADTGLASVLTPFAESLKALSTDASNSSTRAVVIQNGVSLCTALQQEASQLINMVADINVKIGQMVDSINEITAEILSLNKQITSIEAGKTDNANDLRDRRDYLVDQLSSIIDIQVTEDDNGAYLIYGSGTSLVTATTRHQFKTESSMDQDYGYEVLDVVNVKTGEKVTFKNGELAALLEIRDSTEDNPGASGVYGVKKYLNDLSNIAKFLLQEFNDVHKAGVDLNGDAGDNFFGKAGIDYNTDPVADPTGATATFTKGDWISHLQVSSELTNTTTGTNKLAARTLLGEAEQSNPKSGHAILGCDPAVTITDVMDEFTNHLPPTTALPAGATAWQYQEAAVSVSITSVDADGNVTGMSYTYTYSFVAVDANGDKVLDTNGDPYIDNSITGSGPCTQLTAPGTGSAVFQLTSSDPAVNNLTVQVAQSTGNSLGSTYSFSVSNKMQGVGAGDNLVNLYERLKADTSGTFGNATLDTYYATQMGILGAQAKNATSMEDNQQALIDQLQDSRQSICGVVQDEELTDMVRFQKAYNASSRMITAMDEMLDKLINGTGRVGL